MEVLILVFGGLLNLACFVIGASIGQKTAKGEKVEIPNLNPVTAVQNAVEKYEEDKKQRQLDTILENIDAYDGTGMGQKAVK
jgi:Asp-tRNA(Asn)/Glu-tRNA(Gln) amidotransferase B subunit